MFEQLQNNVTSLKARAQVPSHGSRENFHLSGIFIEDALAVNVLIFREHGDTSQLVIWASHIFNSAKCLGLVYAGCTLRGDGKRRRFHEKPLAMKLESLGHLVSPGRHLKYFFLGIHLV